MGPSHWLNHKLKAVEDIDPPLETQTLMIFLSANPFLKVDSYHYCLCFVSFNSFYLFMVVS